MFNFGEAKHVRFAIRVTVLEIQPVGASRREDFDVLAYISGTDA